VSERKSKVVSLEEAASLVADGSTVAIGGLSYYGGPMSLVRALIRRGLRDLTVITGAVAGLQADLLIAADCVKRVISPYLTLEELGLAPNFRRAAEEGRIEVVEIGEAFLAFALKAAASGAPFYPLPLVIAGSDCARVNPLYRKSRDPFTNQEVVCVPALHPDWTLLHVDRADAYGNLQHGTTSYMDGLLARASRRVLATCEELVDNSAVRAESAATTIVASWVRGVVPLRGAAYPTGCPGRYEVDRQEIRRFAKACKSPEGRQGYLQELTGQAPDEASYLKSRGALPPLLSAAAAAQPRLEAPASRGEIIATVIAHSVGDGFFTGAGTGCWEVAAGLRLAQLTHAPNLDFTVGGSGALNPRLAQLPTSLNSVDPLADCEARIELEELFDLELAGAFDVMFASGLQIDAYGNLNLVGRGPRERPTFRGPGTVGLEFMSCVPQVVAFFRNHSKSVFVERVDFISGLGHGSGPRSRSSFGGAEGWGPKLVVTNLAVMDYCPDTRRMRLQSVHPGSTVEEVVANTGFDLILPEMVPETPLPTAVELELLRTQIDCGGLLQRLIP
jgi:acyl CoA:acetate/3-ketoacid CoA transferase alpha subunit/acyl CoA:acetate/3-ketoacid CoA transferase beta subunit